MIPLRSILLGFLLEGTLPIRRKIYLFFIFCTLHLTPGHPEMTLSQGKISESTVSQKSSLAVALGSRVDSSFPCCVYPGQNENPSNTGQSPLPNWKVKMELVQADRHISTSISTTHERVFLKIFVIGVLNNRLIASFASCY